MIVLFLHYTYKICVRPIWFFLTRSDAERAHEQGLAILRFIGRRPRLCKIIRRWLDVPHCVEEVTLAAGFCKYAGDELHALAALGFSRIVLGSITFQESYGNPRPRVFRVPNGNLLNRMRFNNDGAGVTRQKLLAMRTLDAILRISISKSVDVPADDFLQVECDLRACLRLLYDLADEIELNVSSPNSPGLRSLQRVEILEKLLESCMDYMRQLARMEDRPLKPVYVKLSPDMPHDEFLGALKVCQKLAVAGVVLVNTTLSRVGLPVRYVEEAGGISGPCLLERSLLCVSAASYALKHPIEIDGVGGIRSTMDVERMYDFGASRIQLLTALVYEGPFLVHRIRKGLSSKHTYSGSERIQFHSTY